MKTEVRDNVKIDNNTFNIIIMSSSRPVKRLYFALITLIDNLKKNKGFMFM